MAYKFNPLIGVGLDEVGTGGGGSTNPGGSDTQVQFNDGGSFGGDDGLTFNKTTNELTVGASTGDGGSAKVYGDINLDDGGASTTTIQCVTPTANRTISFPNATGTVALVAGSSGQLTYNNAGAQAGATGSVVDSSGNVTIGGLTTLAGSPSANNTSGVLINGTWRTGASSNNPQLLLNPSGTTLSTTWSTSGTGIGVNAASGFLGNLLDLQVNGTSKFKLVAGTSGIGFLIGNDTVGSLRIDNSFGAVLSFGSSVTCDSNGVKIDNTYIKGSSANILEQRNGTNAQTFRVYNTLTGTDVSASGNYERGFLKWNSNVFEIGTEAGSGGGSAQPVRITAARLKLPNLPTYADNVAATTGGLVTGDVYQTATGELRITV